MSDTPVRFALNQRFLVLAATALLCGVGVWAWLNLKIEAYPDVADTEVDIITKFPGRPAEEVEQQVTIPVERSVNAVPRVLSRRSRTIFGLSIVKLNFEEGTDDYFARQQVLEKLRDADLPDGVTPELAPLTTPIGEILRYVVEGKGKSPMELREIQDWVVTPHLLQAPGVADVVNFGGLVRQYDIVIDPQQLQKYDLTIQSVADAISANNASTGGNVITSGASQLTIRTVGRITSRADIERIVVTMQNGTPVFVKDLASVETGALPPSGVLGYTDLDRNVDEDDGVQGIVTMRRGENPSEVLTGVKQKIAELNDHGLPEGVHLVITYDRTDLVNSTLTTVGRTLLEGVTIVLLVLVFFLGSVRAAVAVAITIPLSLLFAFIMMKFTGIPANLLSLGAIDFGIIVDASVVMVESIVRHLSAAGPEERRKGVIRLVGIASEEVQRQIFFAITIIILAYLPLFTLQRVEGKLFSPMAYTLSYAVGGSLLLAFTLVPVVASYLFARRFSEWHNPMFRWLERRYRRAVTRFIRTPSPVLIVAAVIVLGALIMSRSLGTEFLPELDEGGFNIRCVLPAGISFEQAKTYPPIIRREIARSPEVRVIISQLGRNDDGTDPYGPNRIETLVQLRPYDTWKSGKTKKQLLYEIKDRLEHAIPGAGFSFSQPILDNVTEAVTGSASDLAVLVNGDDLVELRKTAVGILNVIRKVPGASESGLEQEGPQTQLVVEVDREAAARYGINVRDIKSIVELAVAGKPVSQVFEDERRFDIALRYTRESRSTPAAIGDILIITPGRARIPLSQVAQIRMIQAQSIIAREDGQRQVGVRTNIRGRDQGSFVAEAQERVAREVQLPPQASVEWGGQFENLTRAKNRLAVVIPVTILLIGLLLFLLFDNSVKYSAIVMSNVPFAIVGGVLALVLRGINFSVSAGVGVVSLFGVAVRSGVLLLSYINYLRQEKLLSLRTAVIEGSVVQLRPVMTMMTVALIGLIPAARATGIGSDVQRPLATVIVGGLLSALVLTLFVMPVIYYVVERQSLRRQRRRGLERRNGMPDGRASQP